MLMYIYIYTTMDHEPHAIYFLLTHIRLYRAI